MEILGLVFAGSATDRRPEMARFVAGVLGLEPPAGRRRERGRVRAARRLVLRRAAPVEVDEPAESDRHRYVHFLAPDGKLYELVEER